MYNCYETTYNFISTRIFLPWDVVLYTLLWKVSEPVAKNINLNTTNLFTDT